MVSKIDKEIKQVLKERRKERLKRAKKVLGEFKKGFQNASLQVPERKRSRPRQRTVYVKKYVPVKRKSNEQNVIKKLNKLTGL